MIKIAKQHKPKINHAAKTGLERGRELSTRAGNALTRFMPIATKDKSEANAVAFSSPSHWAFLAADVVADDKKVTVRLEAPGMRREDFNVELNGNVLTVRGEKRIDRESGWGSCRVEQCAYGSFLRKVVLPVSVKANKTKASYQDGVLRIELLKTTPAQPIETKVS